MIISCRFRPEQNDGDHSRREKSPQEVCEWRGDLEKGTDVSSGQTMFGLYMVLSVDQHHAPCCALCLRLTLPTPIIDGEGNL